MTERDVFEVRFGAAVHAYVGHVSSDLDPVALAGLASKRLYPLRSSFRPTYNMAVNLVAQVGRDRAREVLETSFAQFQADRGVVGLARQAQGHAEALDGYARAMQCHLGDFAEYAGLRRAITDRERELTRQASAARAAEVARSLEGLRVGDVLELPAGPGPPAPARRGSSRADRRTPGRRAVRRPGASAPAASRRPASRRP